MCLKLASLTALLTVTCSVAYAESILIVGDSLSCGGFGREMVQDLSSQGNQVKLYCSVSSRPDHWMYGIGPHRGPKDPTPICQMRSSASTALLNKCDIPGGAMPTFAEILKHNPSDRVIVAMGTNSLPEMPDIHHALPGHSGNHAYNEMIAAIKASGRSCDWIAPPHLEPSKARSSAARKGLEQREESLPTFYKALKEKIAGRCGMISSLESTAPGTPGNHTKEGIHQTDDPDSPGSAAKWRYDHMRSAIREAVKQDDVETPRRRKSNITNSVK